MHGWTTTLSGLSFEQALAKTIEALRAEGFEALGGVDDHRSGIGGAMRRHRMLGVRHRSVPPAAPNAGAGPCHVMVREESPGRVVVSLVAERGSAGAAAASAAPGATDAALCLKRVYSSLDGAAQG